jgi:hypothetical protein
MQQVWKVKRSVWAKKAPALPMAKRNHKGHFISAPEDIKRAVYKNLTTDGEDDPSDQTLMKSIKSKIMIKAIPAVSA